MQFAHFLLLLSLGGLFSASQAAAVARRHRDLKAHEESKFAPMEVAKYNATAATTPGKSAVALKNGKVAKRCCCCCCPCCCNNCCCNNCCNNCCCNNCCCKKCCECCYHKKCCCCHNCCNNRKCCNNCCKNNCCCCKPCCCGCCGCGCGCCRRRRRDHSNVVKRNNNKTARFSRLKRVMGKEKPDEQAIETIVDVCGTDCDKQKVIGDSKKMDMD